MFKWLIFLMSMMMLKIVDDDGAGASGDDDIGDFDIDDEEIEDDDKNKEPKEDNPPDELKKEIEDLKAFREQVEAEKAVLAESERLSAKYPDFDISKIADKLKEMSPEEQELYNNPLGWENLYLTHFSKKSVNSDPFDPGRGASDEPFDFEKGLELARSGDKKSLYALQEHAVSM